MAIKNSNLYAEKIFAEHPLALWTLDDDISFLQLFSDSQQDFFNQSLWSYTNLNKETVQEYSITPIQGSPQSRFSAAASGVFTSKIQSVFTLSSSSFFSDERTTACFSAHVYQSSIYISGFDIGIEYDGEEDYSSYSFGTDVEWHKLSHTFDIPNNKNISFFIRIFFSNDEFASINDFEFQINGVSLGQWSEQYNSSSRGFNDVAIPSEIQHVVSSSSSYTCTVADAYGLDDSINGFYLIKNKQIYAENSGLPLAFGSQNSTKITKAPDGNPSIIIPGMGFLNEAGRYNSYTFEAWIRLDNLSADKIKIIGPVFSDDGIYVEEGYLSVRVGGIFIKSYFVGKWYRPMLVHFKYNQNYVSVYVNGEEVIFENVDSEKIILPEYDIDGKVQDWIGIYGSDLVSPFEIDCISILPYDLPLEMAKRRFVYGQGVGDIEFSNSIYRSETILFDYPTSQYATNFIYPDMNRWKDALAINLDTSSSYITPIDYDLPLFQSKSQSLYSDWLESNRIENISNPDNFDYFMIKPGSASTIVEPALFYENINITNEPTYSISGVFKANELVDIQQPLMIFNNKSTYESLRIILDPDYLVIDGGNSQTSQFDDENDYGLSETEIFFGTDDFGDSSSYPDEEVFLLKYIYTNYDGTETLLHQESVSRNNYFNAGISFIDFQTQHYDSIGNFFSSPENISLTIGKYENDNFLGRIYCIHFSNSFTYEKDLSSFFDNGVVKQITNTVPVYEYLMEHTSTYSLIPFAEQNSFLLDIGVYGYWEDMQPLAYFGKYVYDENNEKYYDLDLLQINIDAPKNFLPDSSQNNYILNYDALQLGYSQYNDLQLEGNYSDLQAIDVDYSSNRSETSVKSFITFKHFSDAINKQYSSFINTEPLPTSSIIEFHGNDYEDTKYEFSDKSVIIPPEEDFQNYYLGLHIEVKVRGIKSKRFLIRRLEIASLAFNDNSPTEIGSRYSEQVSPFTRIGNNFNYKLPNPITIYKDTSPFLYLTDDSGMMCNPFDVSASATRGFYSNINKNEDDNYIFGALQSWIRFPYESLGNDSIPIMSIKQESKSIDFYIEPEVGGQRGFIYAYDSSTGLRKNDIVYFQDGQVVDNLIIYPMRWTSINSSFLDPLIFNNFNGRIEFYEGILFNNISKFIYSNNAVNTFKQIFSKWYQVFYNENNYPAVNTWGEIETPTGQTGSRTWRQATASLQANQYTINGQQIYNNQTGLSVSVTDDTSRLSIYSNGSDILTEVVWQTLEKSPV